MYPTTILEKARYLLDSNFESVFERIDTDCSHYLQSRTTLFKPLPAATADVQRVKLRHRRSDDFHQAFNEAFDVTKLYERSLTCYTNTLRELPEGMSWFAIYPPNGFEYVYNPACNDINTLRDIDPSLLKQLVGITYFSEQLQSHSHLDPEVIIFNVPAYFAVRI